MDEEAARNILGVEDNASKEEIEQKRQELVKKNHPDQGGSTELFKEIEEAYNLLISNLEQDHSNSNLEGNQTPSSKNKNPSEDYKKPGETVEDSTTKSTPSNQESEDIQQKWKELKLSFIMLARAGVDGFGVVVISAIVLLSADVMGFITSETAKIGLYLTFPISVGAVLRRVWVFSSRFNEI
jgi:curved DNA-binding protein CbpA